MTAVGSNKNIFRKGVLIMKRGIEIGDIIIVDCQEFVETDIFGNGEFVYTREAWRVDDVTNNGRIKAHDRNGNRRGIHALDNRPPYYPRLVKVIPQDTGRRGAWA